MKRRRALIAFSMVLVISVFLVVGCGGKKSTTDASQETPAEQKPAYVMKLGHDQMPDSPHHKAALKFAQLVEERTNGGIKVEVYPSQQLGGSREMIEGMQLGTIEATVLASGKYAGFDMTVGILDLPFLFPSVEDAYRILDGPIGDKILACLEDDGIKAVAYWSSGFKHLTGNFPIQKPDDYKGKKIRVMENPILIAQFKALGADAIPIDFYELYNALQQGTVDGQENTLVAIYSHKLYEVQKYLVLSNHGMIPYIFAFSKGWYESLPEEYRTILKDTARELASWERAELHRVEKEEWLPVIKSSGINVTNMTADQFALFREKMGPVYETMAGMLDDKGKEILDELIRATSD